MLTVREAAHLLNLSLDDFYGVAASEFDISLIRDVEYVRAKDVQNYVIAHIGKVLEASRRARELAKLPDDYVPAFDEPLTGEDDYVDFDRQPAGIGSLFTSGEL
jgi:hypothetical protein